ncbi:hypothetical protein [Helicobacter japonicus]|uniref:hypothetical protein n=1 Tax=Helicobacter japonicus TaxID=425400 RepID=UPI0025AEB045|nr:hypothetical protein [Helicobacter japonicus]
MSIFLNACVASLNNTPLQEDTSLPPLNSVKTIPDVSSIAFEWKFIQNDNITGFAKNSYD